jgi:signal transduction histidine kinase
MTIIRRLLLRGRLLAVLLEACVVALAALSLVFSVLGELPARNVPFTFFCFTQLPVGWAALRLTLACRGRSWRGWLPDLGVALGLRVIIFLVAWSLAALFSAQAYIHYSQYYALDVLFYTASLLPFLAYRLLIRAWIAWRRLIEQRFLWMLVNSHLLTVGALVALASILLRVQNSTQSAVAFYPSGWLANVVLELVRAVIPWVGVTLIGLVVAEAAFLLPTLFISYVNARRFVGRISILAQAMQHVQHGELDVRVHPVGHDEIAQLQDDFNQMASDLQSERKKVQTLLQNQRELAAVISHELRTPLTVMRAYIEDDLSPQRAPLPPEYKSDLQTLQHETLKLQALVEDLFTLSQLDANRLSLTCTWVEPPGVVEHVATALQKVAWDSKQIELSVQIQQPLPRVWADARRLEQALSNLIQNAIRHTAQGGVIVLQVRAVEMGVEFAVLDSGTGVLPEDMPHIWERFYRGAQGDTSGRVGIGLALVKELVEEMGGTVGAQSDAGEGSRFWLRLGTTCATATNLLLN